MNGLFILASLSPRRNEMLTGLGLEFTVEASGVEENHLNGETPAEHALRLARTKAMVVAARHPGAWVLAADTIVVVDGTILGKPTDPENARAMLRRLSGREHRVITAFFIVGEGGARQITRAVESSVFFRDLDDDEIDWYVASDEPYDKAGGYAIQGKAASFVAEIRGSGTNVIGLPLAEVVQAMKRLNIVRFSG
ncbi:MAG: Maf family protein [Syntrophales bacterium]|jgi:septum formation protein|nr:Maf family protein [Syntrophales bacterium]MCK9528892.1 Maf family protein [Syntrophales bacterium]MDX9922944.1 Maf family protein [Syntrophales bacterium]